MGLSLRAYARHRGVSHVAVKKAIDTGRITPQADGTIDAAIADAQWAQNTLQPRKTAHPEPVRHTGSRPRPDVVVPSLSTGGTSLLQARTVNEVIKVQLNKVELAHRKKELVDRAQALAHVFKLARNERDAWLNWPARIAGQLAAELSIDAYTMHLALEAAVREHLQEQGELRARVD